MALLFLPLDINFICPPEQEIFEWFENNKILDLGDWNFRDGQHEWALVATGQPVTDWRSISAYASWQKQNYVYSSENKTKFAPGFAEKFPSIVSAIEQMPFKEIGAVGMLKQLAEIEEHRDTYDPNEPVEPRRYMIYLTNPSIILFG